MRRKKLSTSITDARALRRLQGESETVEALDSPSKRSGELKPWIDFVNLLESGLPDSEPCAAPDWMTALEPAFIERFADAGGAGPRSLSGLAMRLGRKRGQTRARRQLHDAYQTIRAILARAPQLVSPVPAAEPLDSQPSLGEQDERGERGERGEQRGVPDDKPFDFQPSGEFFDFQVGYVAGSDAGEGRRLHFEPDPLMRDFFKAAEGAEISRFRKCPICGALFYALRAARPERGADAGTKACSKRCANAFRVRKHREKQEKYELNRKFKRAGVRPEGE